MVPQREEGAMMPIPNEGCLAERVRELQSFPVFAMRAVDVGCVKMIAEKLTGRPYTLNPEHSTLNTMLVGAGCPGMTAKKLTGTA